MLFSNQRPLSNLFQPRQKDSSGVFFKIFILFYFIQPRRLWLVCGVSRIETSSNPAAALTPPCGFSFVSPYRKKSCDFFRGLRIFLCKSFKRYMGIIRTDCDYRKQSTPSGVGAPPLLESMQRIAAAPLLHFFRAEKVERKTPFITQTPLG